jgi:glycosyltransferase involved in cell wall biosynthesis
VSAKPRVLIVGRTRYRLPLDDSLRKKFDALAQELDVRVLSSARDGSPTEDGVFTLVPRARPGFLDGLWFHLSLPTRVARQLRVFKPDAILVQGAHEGTSVLLGRRLAGSHAPIILDVHGDWRSATRLYGSPLRRLLDPVSDRLARLAVRRADAVRTISPYTTGLVRELGLEPAAIFPAFMDLEPFTEAPRAPLPPRPAALFVGVLERYKNVDGLAEAWRVAAPQVPGATLHVVGRGTLTDVVRQLVADLPEQTRWTSELPPEGVARAMDEARFLVLPSRSEGLGRVVIEAFCRGRPVLGSRVGGIPNLVEDGVNGVLVDPGDTEQLAQALVRLLGESTLVEALAEGARRSAETWQQTPTAYADQVRHLVERVRNER